MKIAMNILKIACWLWILFFGFIGLVMTFVVQMGAVSLLATFLLTVGPALFLVWRHKVEKSSKANQPMPAATTKSTLTRAQQKVRLQEREVVEKEVLHAQLVGIEKMKQDLKNKLDELNASKEKAFELSLNHENSIKARKKDSAIRGGLASGLAGSAAGVMVAASAERDNRNAKEQERVDRSRVRSVRLDAMGEFARRIRQVEAFSNELANVQLSEALSKEELFKQITVEEQQCVVTSTGATQIQVKVKSNGQDQIDGALQAVFVDEAGEEVGSAMLSLPLFGLLKERTLCGLCIETQLGKTYQVVIKPLHLWSVEYLPSTEGEELSHLFALSNKLRYLRLHTQYVNEAYLQTLVRQMEADDAIYYDHQVDSRLDLINEVFKLCKVSAPLDAAIQKEVRKGVATLLGWEQDAKVDYGIRRLNDMGFLKVQGDQITILVDNVVMRKAEWEATKQDIEHYTYAQLAQEVKMYSERPTVTKYENGGRRRLLVNQRYAKEKEALMEQYGTYVNVTKYAGRYEIEPEVSFDYYLNPDIRDESLLVFFLEGIKRHVLGAKHAQEVVALREAILTQAYDVIEEDQKRTAMKKKLGYAQA